jgi:hypothetical protein
VFKGVRLHGWNGIEAIHAHAADNADNLTQFDVLRNQVLPWKLAPCTRLVVYDEPGITRRSLFGE